MKKDKLDAIGYVDGQLIEKADQYSSARKKNIWIMWSVLAACLCLCLVGAFTRTPQEVEMPAPDDGYESVCAIPMVYVNDQLYVQSYDCTIFSEKQDDFIDIGEITKNILTNEPDSDTIPKNNFETNQALVGCEVFQYDEDIVVYVENIGYMLFVAYGGPDTDEWNKALG